MNNHLIIPISEIPKFHLLFAHVGTHCQVEINKFDLTLTKVKEKLSELSFIGAQKLQEFKVTKKLEDDLTKYIHSCECLLELTIDFLTQLSSRTISNPFVYIGNLKGALDDYFQCKQTLRLSARLTKIMIDWSKGASQ